MIILFTFSILPPFSPVFPPTLNVDPTSRTHCRWYILARWRIRGPVPLARYSKWQRVFSIRRKTVLELFQARRTVWNLDGCKRNNLLYVHRQRMTDRRPGRSVRYLVKNFAWKNKPDTPGAFSFFNFQQIRLERFIAVRDDHRLDRSLLFSDRSRLVDA